MNKPQRLMALLMSLNTKRKYSLRELAQEFGVSKRTILRDLQDLELLGVPLYAEHGPAGGYQVLKDRTLPSIQFTEHEAVAFFFASQSLGQYGALPFDAELKTALDKFLRHLPEDTKERIMRLQAKLRLWVPTHELGQPYMRRLLDASMNGLPIEAEYESERGRSRRKLLPLGLYAMNGLWYCPAWELDSGQVKTFRTDRFAAIEELPAQEWSPSIREQMRTMAQTPLDQWLGPMDEDGSDRLELQAILTRRGVLRCSTDVWLAQGLNVREDGSGTVVREMSRSYVDWAASFFASLGSDARVEQPPEVRCRIRELAMELTGLYQEEE
ncbi:helix-turn-helix transcriptional regulator [Gorillibacterium sp. sgz5001074]|uniref:helix-turn-helix transcriptional regulator n=1 Tax=Gorillibacterium sp. sgz5001074 TaxID=3446695 RepID=UPI003F680345